MSEKNLLAFLFSFFDKQQRQKSRLVKQIKSKNNSAAIEAINMLRKLRDDSRRMAKSNDSIYDNIRADNWAYLAEEDFSEANLQGADISGVGFNFKKTNLRNINLRDSILNDTILDEAILINADLRRAKMEEVHMIGANLQYANLQEADIYLGHLHGADFSFANLYKANLQDARMNETNFYQANLQYVNLEYADFSNANLEGAIFDKNYWGEVDQGGYHTTKPTLPDGSKFVREEDLERFTNRDHPNFWRPKTPVIWGGNHGTAKNSDLGRLDLRNNDHY